MYTLDRSSVTNNLDRCNGKTVRERESVCTYYFWCLDRRTLKFRQKLRILMQLLLFQHCHHSHDTVHITCIYLYIYIYLSTVNSSHRSRILFIIHATFFLLSIQSTTFIASASSLHAAFSEYALHNRLTQFIVGISFQSTPIPQPPD